MDRCYGKVSWCPGNPRRVAGADKWKEPLRWDREARRQSRRYRVFCASLADLFDAEAPTGARDALWDLLDRTTSLDWLLLTKWPENMGSMLPWAERGDHPDNVWLGVTAENKLELARRLPILRVTRAAIRFLSCEPLLEDLGEVDLTGIDWVIVGASRVSGLGLFRSNGLAS